MEPSQRDCPFCEGVELIFHPEDEEYRAYFACPECQSEFVEVNNQLQICIETDLEEDEFPEFLLIDADPKC